jgi:hypothetical protein
MVWRQLKWLLPLVFCRSDPDASRWDLDAVTSECCSAFVGLTNGSGLVARVNQRNGLPGMRSRTGEVRPISRGLRSDLFRSRMPFSSEKPLTSVRGCLRGATLCKLAPWPCPRAPGSRRATRKEINLLLHAIFLP